LILKFEASLLDISINIFQPGATGWTFDIFYTGKAPWYYGYLYGDYNGCGWILNNELSNTGSKGQVVVDSFAD
tara:strand:- start:28 stop:246 length:219 start_codon:yes stop_codon:yes gene_type:complete